MDSSPIIVRNESQPIRCEICHQSDQFDPETGACLRCAEVEADLKNARRVVVLDRKEREARLREFHARLMRRDAAHPELCRPSDNPLHNEFIFGFCVSAATFIIGNLGLYVFLSMIAALIRSGGSVGNALLGFLGVAAFFATMFILPAAAPFVVAKSNNTPIESPALCGLGIIVGITFCLSLGIFMARG